MALDLHSKVTIKSIERLELAHGDTVLIRVVYRVKHGRKDHKLWALPSDFRGTGIFPICYRRMNQGRYGDVLDMHDNILWTGDLLTCRKIVAIANKHYLEGA